MVGSFMSSATTHSTGWLHRRGCALGSGHGVLPGALGWNRTVSTGDLVVAFRYANGPPVVETHVARDPPEAYADGKGALSFSLDYAFARSSFVLSHLSSREPPLWSELS